MDAMVDLEAAARDELEAALEERDHAQDGFDFAIGTSTEMRAYERLRRAMRRVAEADRRVRRAAPRDR